MLTDTDTTKDIVLSQSIQWWNPGKTRQWQRDGISLVMGQREGYSFYDLTGKRYLDLHLNGGTFNLGHRNPEIIAALQTGLAEFDIGNHHFPSIARAQLAEVMEKATPPGLKYAIFSTGGSEAIDVAVKCARYATQRKKIVSIQNGYHGHTGLAVTLGHERYAKPFLCEGNPDEIVQVPYNDIDAMDRALSSWDVAAVVLETIPATYGFPLPDPAYLGAVKALCERYGTLYIADEVQTGLLRTGKMWGIQHYGVQPDILVTAKGLSGGIYPIACTMVSEQAGHWMHDDGFAHMSTFGGSELGCVVALKVMEITQRESVQKHVRDISEYLRAGLTMIQHQFSDWFVEIRQLGLVMGLVFGPPSGAKAVMRALFDNGVWAMYSMLDERVLQFKPGLLIDQPYCDDVLNRLETSIRQVSKQRR